MGAVRQRFNQAERALLVAGDLVEVKHATTWRLAEVESGEIGKDSTDQQYVWVIDRDRRTRTASPGERRWAMPKGIRARAV